MPLKATKVELENLSIDPKARKPATIQASPSYFPPLKRRYRMHHDRPRATMEASTEDIHQFIMFLWSDVDELPKRIPRLSLDIWLDILLSIRNAVGDDLEKHRYTSIKSRVRNPYPDNVFSWMLNQLVELGFIVRQRENIAYFHGRAVRYFLTDNGKGLVSMFENFVDKKRLAVKNRQY
jgi:DNA-binding HxlR family transcriptional regulator